MKVAPSTVSADAGVEGAADDGDGLEPAPVLAGRLEADPPGLGGDEVGGLHVARRAGAPPLHRVVGVGVEPAPQVGRGDRGRGGPGRRGRRGGAGRGAAAEQGDEDGRGEGADPECDTRHVNLRQGLGKRESSPEPTPPATFRVSAERAPPFTGRLPAPHYMSAFLSPFLRFRRSTMALVDRVKNILLTPKTEWEVIDAEPTTVADLYKGYIIPLAAIGPVAQAIG